MTATLSHRGKIRMILIVMMFAAVAIQSAWLAFAASFLFYSMAGWFIALFACCAVLAAAILCFLVRKPSLALVLSIGGTLPYLIAFRTSFEDGFVAYFPREGTSIIFLFAAVWLWRNEANSSPQA